MVVGKELPSRAIVIRVMDVALAIPWRPLAASYAVPPAPETNAQPPLSLAQRLWGRGGCHSKTRAVLGNPRSLPEGKGDRNPQPSPAGSGGAVLGGGVRRLVGGRRELAAGWTLAHFGHWAVGCLAEIGWSQVCANRCY